MSRSTIAQADLLLTQFEKNAEHVEKFGSVKKSQFNVLFDSFIKLRNKILTEQDVVTGHVQRARRGRVRKAYKVQRGDTVDKDDKIAGSSSDVGTKSQLIVSDSNLPAYEEKEKEKEKEPAEDRAKLEKEALIHDVLSRFHDEKGESPSLRSTVSPSEATTKSSGPQFPLLNHWNPQDPLEHVKTLRQNFSAVHTYVNSCSTASIPSYFHNVLYQSYMDLSDKLLKLPTKDSKNVFRGTQVDLQPLDRIRKDVEWAFTAPQDIEPRGLSQQIPQSRGAEANPDAPLVLGVSDIPPSHFW